MKLEEFIARRLRRSCWAIDLPELQVRAVLARHGIAPWFAYAFTQRWSRWHVWEPCAWLVRRCGVPQRVFETGCGCAFNLIWFGMNGSTELFGSDRDPQVVAAGRELATLAGVRCDLWADDALRPERLPDPVQALLALNWTYHAPEFDLAAFLATYRQDLTAGGWLLIDLIDRQYDAVPNNQYLTSDWHRPVSERRPSEYLWRYHEHEARAVFHNTGFRIAKVFTRRQTVPKMAYVLVSDPR